MYKKISDYGVIGNLRTIALIGLDASIDWLCLPDLDSPSVFGAILDDEKGGRLSITPVEQYDSVAGYIKGTNVLVTSFRTKSGQMRITDFMPLRGAPDEERTACSAHMFRKLECLSGSVEARLEFTPRFDYGRAATKVTDGGDFLKAVGDGESLFLKWPQSQKALPGSGALRVWRLREGEIYWLGLYYGEEGMEPPDEEDPENLLGQVIDFWKNWLNRSETGKEIDYKPFQEMMDRAALALKLLSFSETGAIAAAGSTSLPEAIGGVRNWDYRFSWIRDSSLTIQALYRLGRLSEMKDYLDWMKRVIRNSSGHMQIMYGLRGETDIPEMELDHLEGYKGASPVRIGNGAAKQKQLDVYGEILDSALKLSNYVGKVDIELWSVLRKLCEYVEEHWQDKDSGIWEVRGGAKDFVYSKMMCWVALDRGVTIARRYGFPADTKGWIATRDRIKKDILDKGWSEEKQAFTFYYGTDALDAGNLLMPLFGFLDYDDPRIVSTVEAIQKELTQDGFVYRYLAEDGLPGGEAPFLICSFWLVENLVGQGRRDEAEALLHKLDKAANHLGLYSEEYDIEWREALGNFPQAFSHAGYVNAVAALIEARSAKASKPEITGVRHLLKRRCVFKEHELNPETHQGVTSAEEAVTRLKKIMNTMRGAFFNTSQGRVAYEEMSEAKIFQDYVEAAGKLAHIDLESLKSRSERMAFWINLFNALVIHGVIALGVRDSIKEVPWFFRRVKYRVGGFLFSAADMEHGVLRGNRRPPYNPFVRFRVGDPRRRFSFKKIDPRIHFALVCASVSCPPIEVYTAENLDEELDISGRAFLNSGGLVFDSESDTVHLSRTFKWYGRDFGGEPADLLRFLARYLYDDDQRERLIERAHKTSIRYQAYDWRLNR
jgi:GH15 family glucan-1,4-alpha-glucosidase